MRNKSSPIDNLLFQEADSGFSYNLPKRHKIAGAWLIFFQLSTFVGILALSALLYNIINDSSGFVAFKTKEDPNAVTGGVPFGELTQDQLISILQENLSPYRYRTLENEKPFYERSHSELVGIINLEIIKPTIEETWSLMDSLLNKEDIIRTVQTEYPGAYLQFRVWMSKDFLTLPQSSDPLVAGVKTAILGSIWVIFITIVIAFPIGVGAAIYLEEYANGKRWINRVIQTNINNLAAVPSIIYGILGLTIFVRILEPLTSGAIFGFGEPSTTNGRTILSGGLTLAILVLPIIIINAQEAIRAVPASLRQASYGMGATQWQTIWHHVLPNSVPGILTGTILALSRAFGETAPLIVVGVSTYITVNPSNIFSKFTTLPAQIYQWTARPQDEWRNLAAAAIIILLILLISMNTIAVILRNKYTRKYA
jgi:phosphate transport system permease protein